MHSTSRATCEFELNPYDSFMRNHLKHYGYYTGQSDNYKTSGLGLTDWERSRSFSLSDHIVSDTEYENQALKESKLDDDNRFTDGHKRTTQLVFSHSAGKVVPKLKEPRNLYALSKEAGPQQAPRWPADMEVLPEMIQHITYVPTEREPFYHPTGFEKMPMSLAEGEGRTVYYNPTSKDAYFLRSRVGGSRKGCLPRAWKPKSADDTTLIFESRFESGNLMKAIQRSEFEYDLQLRYDLYTDKHTQWYYFRVQNVRKNIKYRFTITNFMKPGSLYNCGMKPLMYSEMDAKTRKIGWRRLGEEIKYYKNDMRRTDVKGDRSYYSLTWTCQFPHDGDTCFFAHCYPYTYSDLQQYLLRLSNDPVRSKYCKQRVLCRSLAGNLIYILTITSAARNPEDTKRKKAVVLTARVHPGETNASWMMKGFLDYLTSDSIDAKLLRGTFVFKIVPMLNPDGVIVGNYRCSLAGRDLNRNYRSVLRDSFPSVSNTKAMIKKLLDEREVVVYCDLHGHSRKQNVFIYGCENKKDKKNRLREKIFPIILGKNANEKFSSTSCKYKVQKSKEGTGRVVMWQMGIMNSYTMEATFCGSTLGNSKFYHFRTVDYEAMGYHFCDSLLDYCDPDQNKCEEIYRELEEKLKADILNHLERIGTPIPEGGVVDLSQDYTSAIESSTTGSDSSADDGLPVHLLALAPKLTKKKKLKTRKERDKKRNSLGDKSNQRLKDSKIPEKNDVSGKNRAVVEKKEEVEKKPSTPKLKDKEKSDKTGDGFVACKEFPMWAVKQKLKYKHTSRPTVHSAGRARHINNRSGDGLPIFAQERCETKAIQKTEYLEALTNAYLMSGVLKSSSQDVPAFRYSASGFGVSTSGLPLAHLEGLCPHHEKAFADQFVANQLSGLTFEDDKIEWTSSPTETNQSGPERRSAPPSKSTAFSLANMASMRSQSESPPHYQPLPLDEYIRPTSRQGPSLMTGPTHASKTPLRPSSRGVPDELLIETSVSPQWVPDCSDFVRRETDQPPSPSPSPSPQPQLKHSSTTTYGMQDVYPDVRTKVPPRSQQVSHSRGQQITSGPQFSSDKPAVRERKMITPVYIETSGQSPRYKDVNHKHNSVTVLQAHNTPVMLVSGGESVERAQNRQTMGTGHKPQVIYKRGTTPPSPSQMLEETSLRRSQASTLSHRSTNGERRFTQEEPKSHRCTTEATPISDPVVFPKQSSQSSHHFKPPKDFYASITNDGKNSRSSDVKGGSEHQSPSEKIPYRKPASVEYSWNVSGKEPPQTNNNRKTVAAGYVRNMVRAQLSSDLNNNVTGYYSGYERSSIHQKKSLNANNSASGRIFDANNFGASYDNNVRESYEKNLEAPYAELMKNNNSRERVGQEFENLPRFESRNSVFEEVTNLLDMNVPDVDLTFPVRDEHIRYTTPGTVAVQNNLKQSEGSAPYEQTFKTGKISEFQKKALESQLINSQANPNNSAENFSKSELVSSRIVKGEEDDRGHYVKEGRRKGLQRQQFQSSVASAEDFQALNQEGDTADGDEAGLTKKSSNSESVGNSNSRYEFTQRWRQDGQMVSKRSPSPPSTLKHINSTRSSKEDGVQRTSSGFTTEMFHRKIVSPRSADHYIQVSKLALQLRQRNIEERYKTMSEERREQGEEEVGYPSEMAGGSSHMDSHGDYERAFKDKREFGETKRSTKSSKKMVAVVTPMTQGGNPVSQRGYTSSDRSSTVVQHQGGFQGTKSNPLIVRNKFTRKK
ncbi:Cytosolic carboxypeptidase 2 [Holothuria leucospilota]|uniref:Cytosolic carboxypeptidase 2 n=1 Tax=Holothuria leucospilota TaxID=206669 RepID=A0A9Q1BGV1_HOLLE|nr:Cytosolic carboxypeptidase 2 [Holothuria leucospilota]